MKTCACQKEIEIPCNWYTELDVSMSLDDPEYFLWWEALQDPILTNFIEEAATTNSDVRLASLQSKEQGLEAINLVAADIAKNYLELRGQQQRLKVLEQKLDAQNTAFVLSQGLSKTGFSSGIDQNKFQEILYSILVQKSQVELLINKSITALSSLLNIPLDCLYEALFCPQKLPELPHYIPVGSPMELLGRNPCILLLKREYENSGSFLAFDSYQKKLFNLVNDVENVLAALHFERQAARLLEMSYELKKDDYQLTLDLYNQGLKGEEEVLGVYLDLTTKEDLLLQAKLQLLQSYVNLYQLLKTGWQMR